MESVEQLYFDHGSTAKLYLQLFGLRESGHFSATVWLDRRRRCSQGPVRSYTGSVEQDDARSRLWRWRSHPYLFARLYSGLRRLVPLLRGAVSFLVRYART